MKNFVFNQPPGLNNPSNFLFLFQGNFYPENYPRNYPEKHPQNYPGNEKKEENKSHQAITGRPWK